MLLLSHILSASGLDKKYLNEYKQSYNLIKPQLVGVNHMRTNTHKMQVVLIKIAE